jgi:HSP20 family protein
MRFPELHFSDAFDRLRDEMERLATRFGGNGGTSEGFSWMPLADLEEHDDDFTIRCEMPGVDPENIDVSVDDRTLTIVGRRSERHEESDTVSHTSECRYGSFRRSFTLPTEIDASKVSAENANGVLMVTVPKGPESAGRRIPVKAVKHLTSSTPEPTRRSSSRRPALASR